MLLSMSVCAHLHICGCVEVPLANNQGQQLKRDWQMSCVRNGLIRLGQFVAMPETEMESMFFRDQWLKVESKLQHTEEELC